MISGFFGRIGIARESATGGNISFIAYDRIDSGRLGFLVKLECTVKVAVVGQCQRVHPECFGTLDQPVNRTCTIEKAVVAVAVQVDKGTIDCVGCLIHVEIFLEGASVSVSHL